MKEDCRDARALGWLEDLAHDLRFSMRALARTPGFTLIAVLMLALGIGANTAMFSVIHAVLLRDLPYPEPDRLVSIYEANPSRGIPRFAVAPPNFLDWQAQSRSFEAMFAYNNGDAVLTGRGEARRLKALTTTIDLFKALGVQPFLGRAFNREDGTAGHSHVAVLSHGLWRGSFSSDAAVIGQNIDLDGEPYTVIGV